METDVERPGGGAAPARAKDLIGYGALIVAPHPDDEVLGCGGLIASVVRPDAVGVLVASDGSLSPAGAPDPAALVQARRAETRQALSSLGVPSGRIQFLDLPDGSLAHHPGELDRALSDAVARSSATDVFVPFRFDRHPDHLAVHAAGERLSRRAGIRLWEYFVYPFWRLLPGRDVRRRLRPHGLYALELAEEARAAKRAALDAYRSQTTLYAPGQSRRILAPDFLDMLCAGPEMFLRCEPGRPGTAVLRGRGWWFRIVRRVEPPLKRAKERILDGLGQSR